MRYTPYYCEENIWHLCQDPEFAGCNPLVVFISNANRECAFWFQRAAPQRGQAMCWDYHVILLYYRDGWQVWDMDSVLQMPMEVDSYLQRTFLYSDQLDNSFHPRFRVIQAQEFAANFSSDRSHMLDKSGAWLQPPPKWPTIGGGLSSNLNDYIDVETPGIGILMDLHEFKKEFSGNSTT